MKNYLSLILCSLALFSCGKSDSEQEKPATPLSEQNLKFEIYDSLVVDYLGNMMMMDISPNRETFLLYDQSSDTLFVTTREGTILDHYQKSGEGPGNYNSGRYGKAVFLNNQEFLIPATEGIFQYSLDGRFEKKYSAEFKYLPNLIISFGNSLFIKDGKAYTNYGGRYSDDYGSQGIGYQENATLLEEIDLESGEYTPVIPFPSESRFSSSEFAYRNFFFYPIWTIAGDSLYLSFKNEPKIYTFALDDLASPKSVKTIPLPEFLEESSDSDQVETSINLEDLFQGNINSLYLTEDHEFLIDYLTGLTKEEYDEAMAAAGDDFNNVWGEAEKLNSGGYILFDGKNISPIIEKPEILGNMGKFVSKDEIWFSLNFEQAENDYSVIYKTRIVPAN